MSMLLDWDPDLVTDPPLTRADVEWDAYPDPLEGIEVWADEVWDEDEVDVYEWTTADVWTWSEGRF